VTTLPKPVGTATRYTFAHAIPRILFRRQAKLGLPLAQIMTDAAVREDPREKWAELRAMGRLVQGRMGWITTDHAITTAALRSEDFGVARLEEGRLARLIDASVDPMEIGPIDPPSLLALNAPDHTRLRRLFSGAFTPRRVAAMESSIEATAHRLLDEAGDQIDLVEEYAAHLPVTVIADLLGVPEEERAPLVEWGNAAALFLDAGLSWREFRSAQQGLHEMHTWMGSHIERLRREPGDDLLSAVIHRADESEQPPTPDELRMLGLLVLGAGFETTVNLLGNGVAALAAHPEQRAWLVDHPDGWANAVEEVLRWDSPVQFNARLARRDTEVKGRSIRSGQVLITVLGAVNRDPRVFEDPDSFDVRRSNAGDHLAFSAGAHFCLGAGLARIEGRVGLRVLHERFPELRLLGNGTRRTTQVLRGYSSLPVSLPKTEAAR
jgi:cytochrome P450